MLGHIWNRLFAKRTDRSNEASHELCAALGFLSICVKPKGHGGGHDFIGGF